MGQNSLLGKAHSDLPINYGGRDPQSQNVMWIGMMLVDFTLRFAWLILPFSVSFLSHLLISLFEYSFFQKKEANEKIMSY